MLTINFDLSEFESVELIPISDCHIGNPLAQEHLLKETIDYILEEPDDPKMARICLLNGDLTESVTRTTKAGDIFEQTMTPSVQVATMVKYLRPLAETSKKYPQGKILSYCAGNHDDGRYKDTGISSAESIAVSLGLEDRFSKDGCYSFIKLKQLHSYNDVALATVYNQHMNGGGSTAGGKVNRALKMGLNGGIIADICIGSHVHQPITFKEDYIVPSNKGTLKQRTITYIVTNAFLAYGNYAQRSGMKPSTIKVPKIYIRQGREPNRDRYIYTEVLL